MDDLVSGGDLRHPLYLQKVLEHLPPVADSGDQNGWHTAQGDGEVRMPGTRSSVKPWKTTLRTLLVELINVTSSKSDLNRSPCLHHLLCHSWNYFWVLQLILFLGFGQNIFSISYHIWSRRKFTLGNSARGEKYTAFAGVGEAMLEKRERGEWSRSGREGGRRGRQMRWKHSRCENITWKLYTFTISTPVIFLNFSLSGG